MAIVSLSAPVGAEQLKPSVTELLRPWQEFLSGEAPLLYLGYIWPAPPELGINPLPELVAALVEAALRAGAPKVALAAQAAPGFDFAKTWQLAGYGALKNSAVIHDLALTPRRAMPSRLNLACSALELPLPLLQGDPFVNVAKFRVAEGRLFGSALLNLAALTGLAEEDPGLERGLVDAYDLLAPDLHVIDANRGQRGYQPQSADILLAATDAAALDITLAALAGIPGAELEAAALAGAYGLGCAHAADIHLSGADAKELFKI